MILAGKPFGSADADEDPIPRRTAGFSWCEWLVQCVELGTDPADARVAEFGEHRLGALVELARQCAFTGLVVQLGQCPSARSLDNLVTTASKTLDGDDNAVAPKPAWTAESSPRPPVTDLGTVFASLLRVLVDGWRYNDLTKRCSA